MDQELQKAACAIVIHQEVLEAESLFQVHLPKRQHS